MTIFNSLGSNYKPRHMLNMVFGFDSRSKNKLSSYLEERYDADIALTYKGREAICAALKHLDLSAGSKVAINGYTCFAVYDAVVSAGCIPVYVDIEKDSLNFSAKGIRGAFKKHPDIAAVMIQNTLGTPADIKEIHDVCKKQKVPLVEDLAHSIGLFYKDGREAGRVGDMAALSFSQDKVVDAVSGGALISRRGEPSIKYKRLSYLKFLKDYYYIMNTQITRTGYIWGGGIIYNYVLRKLRLLPRPMSGSAKVARQPDNWHAALAITQFEELDDNLQNKRDISAIYSVELPDSIQLPFLDRANYIRYPILVDDRQSLFAFLKRKGIHISDTWYESVISPGKYLDQTNYVQGECPRAEEIASQMVNLPTHINMDRKEAFKVIYGVLQWLHTQKS